MDKPKVFTLKEHLDAIEVAYSIGVIKSVTREDKDELIDILIKAVVKYAEFENNKK